MRTRNLFHPSILPRANILSGCIAALLSTLAVPSAPAEAPPGSAEQWIDYIAREEPADEVRKRFRERGMPNHFSELLGPRPDDSENGWLHLSHTLASMEDSFSSEGGMALSDLLGGEPATLSKDEWLAAAREIGATREARAVVAAVAEAVRMPHWYPVREWELGYELMIPEVSTFREAARILSLRHRMALAGEAGEGPSAGELQALQVGFSLRIAEEPNLISFLTGVAARLMPVRDARWSLQTTGSIPPPAPFDRAAWEDRFNRALSGERLFGQRIFADIRSGKGPELMDSLRTLGGPDDGKVSPLARMLDALVFFVILGEEDQYLKLMELQASDLDPGAIDAITDEFLSRRRMSLMGIIVPAVSGIRRQIDKMERASRGWEIAAALSESYGETGAYPAEPPVDSGGFRYTLLDDGRSFRLESDNPDDSDDSLFQWTPPSAE
ncbi:MAG: hypothetical protein ACLFRP_02890 [Puniceicoccaceae bacterium]